MSKNHLPRYMREDNHKQNCHHILGQAQRNDYRTDIPQNKILVEITKHNAYNCLMGHNQSPRWVFEFAYEWTNSILTDQAKQKLLDLLSMSDEELYIEELLKRKVAN